MNYSGKDNNFFWYIWYKIHKFKFWHLKSWYFLLISYHTLFDLKNISNLFDKKIPPQSNKFELCHAELYRRASSNLWSKNEWGFESLIQDLNRWHVWLSDLSIWSNSVITGFHFIFRKNEIKQTKNLFIYELKRCLRKLSADDSYSCSYLPSWGCKYSIIKVLMQGKLFQTCTHFLYCSVMSLGEKLNTRRMSQPDMESIFTEIIYEIFWS